MRVFNEIPKILMSGLLLSGLLILSTTLSAQKSGEAKGKSAILKIKSVADFELTGDTLGIAWKKTHWIDVPQREGKLIQATRVKLLYSEKGVYCLFWCEDKKITATLREDFTDLYKEDVVEIFFWTDEKTPLYFEYELSPLNHELAILVPNLNGQFFGWRPWHFEGGRLTRHAVSIVKHNDQVTGWAAEFFIPYTLLKPLQNVPPQKGTSWRVNMYRIDYDEGAGEWSWQLTGINFHDIASFGTLLFD